MIRLKGRNNRNLNLTTYELNKETLCWIWMVLHKHGIKTIRMTSIIRGFSCSSQTMSSSTNRQEDRQTDRGSVLLNRLKKICSSTWSHQLTTTHIYVYFIATHKTTYEDKSSSHVFYQQRCGPLRLMLCTRSTRSWIPWSGLTKYRIFSRAEPGVVTKR